LAEILSIPYSGPITQGLFAFASFHSYADSIVLLYYIKPYRDWCKKLFLKLFRRKKSQTEVRIVTSKTSQANPALSIWRYPTSSTGQFIHHGHFIHWTLHPPKTLHSPRILHQPETHHPMETLSISVVLCNLRKFTCKFT
jgi:hypothetical protein